MTRFIADHARTEILYHSGRQQPFTVWVYGFVERFTATQQEAVDALRMALKRRMRPGRT